MLECHSPDMAAQGIDPWAAIDGFSDLESAVFVTKDTSLLEIGFSCA